MGKVYQFFLQTFNCDSYDTHGAVLVSAVHFGQGYNNALWDADVSTMVFGDGDGVTYAHFYGSLDVTAHELTHAITSRSSHLLYANESGALNEAISDIMGTACKTWNRNWTVDASTWLFASDCYVTNDPNSAIRFLDSPTKDGRSVDYYPQMKRLGANEVPDAESNDYGYVHENSGVVNLAFKLMVTGGRHPRNLTNVLVPSIGMQKAIAIFYYIDLNDLDEGSSFSDARRFSIQAATQLYDQATSNSVSLAWDAVGVP
jgi:Zn-dependent metalloprotease